MLARKYRLSRKDVQAVYKKGHSKPYGFLGAKILPNRLNHARISVVIPKAVVKLATDRNRLKRVILDEVEKPMLEKGSDIILRLFKNPGDEKILRQKVREILT